VQETRYGLRVELPVSYEQPIERVTAALKEHGIGVLTTIDVKAMLKQKQARVSLRQWRRWPRWASLAPMRRFRQSQEKPTNDCDTRRWRIDFGNADGATRTIRGALGHFTPNEYAERRRPSDSQWRIARPVMMFRSPTR
jgi:hypothetical protein